MLVTAVVGNVLTVVRRYGGTTTAALADNMKLTILGNAALEGDRRPRPASPAACRKRNYTQIFTATVEVSGSMQAARAYGVADEADYQKQERIRELLRDLENCVINGVAPAATPQGSSTVRRTMNGIIRSIATNHFVPGVGGIPAGGGGGNDDLNEAVLNAAHAPRLGAVAGPASTPSSSAASRSGASTGSSRATARLRRRRRRASATWSASTRATSASAASSSAAGSPPTRVLLLDSSRIEVLPLAGRRFHYKPLAATGDSEAGQVIGEYTLEFRNENAHGVSPRSRLPPLDPHPERDPGADGPVALRSLSDAVFR